MLYFGYSYCPDVCPLDLQKLMQGYRLFEKQDPARAAKVQPIFITIDPQRDTPQVLKNYVSAFHTKLIGLTGTPNEIAKVAKSTEERRVGKESVRTFITRWARYTEK